ncbi:MAG: hypothetical protein H0U75_07820 [Legionella sp.]|nr:hypothetical protein [Legionella sp.]
MRKTKIKHELALIYSDRQESTLFLMVEFPKKILPDTIGQYILITSEKKQLFYIELNGKPTTVAIDNLERFEYVLQTIQSLHIDSNIRKLSKQDLGDLITSNGGHVPHGLERLRYTRSLFNQLVELTPSKTLQELTRIPLPRQPPLGFQKSFIEFPLRPLKYCDKEYYQEKVNSFLNYLRVTCSDYRIKNAIRISAETYNLIKINHNPKQPICLTLKNKKKLICKNFKIRAGKSLEFMDMKNHRCLMSSKRQGLILQFNLKSKKQEKL